MTMHRFCVQQSLSNLLSTLGRIIGRHPFYFILAPIIISAVMSVGITKMKANRDADHLFTAINGRARESKRLIESAFPRNTSLFADAIRISSVSDITILQVTSKNEATVFQEETAREIRTLFNMVKNIKVTWKNMSVGYDILCAKMLGKCIKNNAEELISLSNEITTGTYKLRYPLDIDNVTFVRKEYVSTLGGISVDEAGYVKEAKGIRVIYLLDITDPTKYKAIKQWQASLFETMRTTEFKRIRVTSLNHQSIHDEMKAMTDRIAERLPIAICTVAAFALLSLMTNDWIRSKPWLGPSACISAGLALITGFGFASFCGIEYIDFNIGLCCIVIGTEVDDAFVIIAAWRSSDTKDSVEKRMAHTYSQSAVSITITSLTSFSSFCIGIATPIPGIQMFCSYAAICIFFSYFYEITFFGGCLALSGYREEKNLNPFVFCVPKQGRAIEPADNKAENGIKEEFLMAFLRDKIGTLLTYQPAKFATIVLFLLNLGVGVYGLFTIKTGNEFSDVLSETSSVTTVTNVLYKYFGQYTFPINIFINERVDYSDVNVQKQIERMLDRFEAHPHIADASLRISWLKYYKLFARHPISRFSLRGYNMSNKQDFIDGLRKVFLRFPQAREFKEDIRFNENYTEIVASRFIVLMKNISSVDTEISLIRDVYQIVDQSSLPLKVHGVMFHFLEQALLVKDLLYQLALASAALISIVFFLVVPNLSCSLSVSVVVLCIICETIGYVSFFKVKLDLLLLTTLTLCVGFSINYPTHLSISFLMAKNLHPNERLKKAIYEIGYPIFQGSVTTIFGIIILPVEPYYAAKAFFTIIAVIVAQTAFHALFVIPVLLTFLGYCNKSLSKSRKAINTRHSIIHFQVPLVPPKDSSEASELNKLKLEFQ